MPVILGGVSNDTWLKERGDDSRTRPVAATVVKRSDDGRARLRLAAAAGFVVGDLLLLDGDRETFSVDVYAVHLDGRLIDVRRFWPLMEMARVTLRRRGR